MEQKPDHLGHRQRLRNRFLERGGDSLADYELLEMLLFAANPRGDTKPLAKALLQEFGSFAAVVRASPDKLRTVKGLGDGGLSALKLVEEAVTRLTREEAQDQPVISSWDRLLAYCRAQLAHEEVENFHLLFLDRKNQLIADERQQRGTVDHTPVYPREVIKRALHHSASAIILVHNLPSGDPTPSQADIVMTREIRDALAPLSIQVHDHLIIGRRGHVSFKQKGLL